MTTKSNQSISKRVLMFCGSALVTSTAVLSFSSEAPAKDRPATIKNHSHAQAICPNLCRQFSHVETYPRSGWYPHKWTGHWKHVAPGEPAAVCGCGEWRLDGDAPKPRVPLPQAANRTYRDWWTHIAHRGLNPADAAREIGGADFKKRKNSPYWQIRLNQEHRVFFTIDKLNYRVKIHQVGGHDPR